MELNIYREVIDDAIARTALNRIRRILRDQSDPFSLPDDTFKKLYRISRGLGHYLLQNLGPHMREDVKISSIPKCLRLFAAIYFLGHGQYQTNVGQDFLTNMHQTSVSNCITEVTNLIIEILGHVVKFPMTNEETNDEKLLFSQAGAFPGIIGCIDCTQIAILGPKANNPEMPGVIFYCRKQYYSLNVQIICNSKLKILNINARFPGSVHDSAIWQTSFVRNHLRLRFAETRDQHSYLLGDSGYPLEPWLLTPILNPANENERAYNIAHRRTRNIIERTNGVLKQRFRCIFRHRTLHDTPQRAAKIIYLCAILHNLCLIRNENWDVPEYQNDNEQDEPQPDPDVNDPRNNNNIHQLGRNVRNMVVNNYFQD